jgi:hypothetical protein
MHHYMPLQDTQVHKSELHKLTMPWHLVLASGCSVHMCASRCLSSVTLFLHMLIDALPLLAPMRFQSITCLRNSNRIATRAADYNEGLEMNLIDGK